MADRAIVLEVRLDTEDVENAYLAAWSLVDAIEAMEAVDTVRVLSGVADIEP